MRPSVVRSQGQESEVRALGLWEVPGGKNPRPYAFRIGGLARLPSASHSLKRTYDQERVRHIPPHNLADSLCRQPQGRGQISGVRGQQSGVRNTPFAKPQGVPPKTQARYMGTRIRSRRAVFSLWMNESENRHTHVRLVSRLFGFVRRAHFRKGVSAYA